MQLSSVPNTSTFAALLNDVRSARWAWCLLAVLIVAVRHFTTDGADPLGPRFGDTDDALRLVQIREFLINGAWYNTLLPSIGAPEALNSHWSRLIDLPVAWLISIFALFLNYLDAELAARIVWPLILLFVVARFLVAEVERQLQSPNHKTGATMHSTAHGGVILLALLLLTSSALFQFVPGRIDHHNAQIACAVIGILLCQRALIDPAKGWLAGSVLGLGLAIGFEALPLVAAVVGLAALLACFDRAARLGITRCIVALAGTLITAYAITTHPAEWAMVECDELSPNLLGLVGTGAAGSGILLMRFRNAAPWVWLGGLALSGAVGLAIYVATNPACASGAFAGMDPVVKTHWLATVVEGKSLLQYAKVQPSGAFGFLAIMAITLVLVIRQAATTRTIEHIFIAGATLLAGLYGFYYIKFMPYGAMLSLVPMAVWIARLPAIGKTPADSVQIRATIACNQTMFIMLAGFAIGIFSNVEDGAKAKMSSSVQSCTNKSDIAALSQLPSGLIISDIDIGPYIALATHHRAYAGPYHRIHTSLRDVIMLAKSPLDQAPGQLAKMNADYLVLCAVDTATKGTGGKPALFNAHMRRGGAFPGLEPISIGQLEGPLKVWKITTPAR